MEQACELNERAAAGARRRGDPETTANSELNLADAFLANDDLASAKECLEGIYRLAKDPKTSNWMKWRYSMHLFASYGEFWLRREDFSKAKDFSDQCLEIADRTNSQKYLVRVWRLKGDIASAQRQWDASEAALNKALSIAETIGNPTQLWKTHFALGKLFTLRKDREQARRSYKAASHVIDQVRAGLQNPRLRASLENSRPVQHVYDTSKPQ